MQRVEARRNWNAVRPVHTEQWTKDKAMPRANIPRAFEKVTDFVYYSAAISLSRSAPSTHTHTTTIARTNNNTNGRQNVI